jgi:hypothetical protein
MNLRRNNTLRASVIKVVGLGSRKVARFPGSLYSATLGFGLNPVGVGEGHVAAMGLNPVGERTYSVRLECDKGMCIRRIEYQPPPA